MNYERSRLKACELADSALAVEECNHLTKGFTRTKGRRFTNSSPSPAVSSS